MNKEDKFSFDYCRKVILGRFHQPNYKVEKLIPYEHGILIETQKSSSCSDAFKINFCLENDQINQCQFSGFGCVIAVSSLDLLLSKIINTPLLNAIEIIQKYLDLLANKASVDFMESLGDLWCFHRIYKQTHRIFCASVGANALLKQLNQLQAK